MCLPQFPGFSAEVDPSTQGRWERGELEPSSAYPACRSVRRALKPSIRVARKSTLASRMHRRVVRPRPATKLSAPVIGEGLLQFRARVHYERPVLRDRLADRPPLQQENFDGASSRVDRLG